MATATLEPVVDQIHRIADSMAHQQQTDRQLLERFAERREQSAFTVLVRRHGPMVFGVCRRVLGHQQDAEDAFQATFLVLAKKAASVHWRESVANWLYGVAYRLSLKLRSNNARRRQHVVQAQDDLEAVSPSVQQWNELRTVLDEELQRMPEHYRAPLVLCYLEGKTRDEAAQQLNWTMPMVKGRLERGRQQLRQRLARRGLTLSAALMPVALHETAAAGVSASVLSETAAVAAKVAARQALSHSLPASVLALTQGVLQTMFWTKTKITAAATIFVALLGASIGLIAHHASADPSAQTAAEGAAPAAVNENQDFQNEQPIALAFGGDDEREGEGQGEREGKAIRGKLKSLDLKKGTVTLTIHRDQEAPRDETFSLSGKKIEVRSNIERPAKIEDLQPGMNVTLYLTAVNDVTGIRAIAPTARVRIRSVDAENGTITFYATEATPSKNYSLVKGARLLLKGKACELADFQDKMQGFATFTLDGKQVVMLRVGGREDEEGEGGEERRRRFAVGIVKKVDVEENTVTLTMRAEGEEFDKTFKVHKEARFALPEKEGGRLKDLKAGMKVALLLAEIKIVVGGRTGNFDGDRDGDERRAVVGELIGFEIAEEGRTITILQRRDAGNVKKTFPLAKEAKLLLGEEREGKLANLKKGARLLLTLGEDRKTVVAIRPYRRPQRRIFRRGTVQEIDAAEKTITVAVRREGGSKNMTFAISKETRFIVPGKEGGRLSDFKVGTPVLLQLADDRETVLSIRVFKGEGDREEGEREGGDREEGELGGGDREEGELGGGDREGDEN